MRLGHSHSPEGIIAEGVMFHNTNIVILDYSTSTIMVLEDISSVLKHYGPIGVPTIEWVDMDMGELKIN